MDSAVDTRVDLLLKALLRSHRGNPFSWLLCSTTKRSRSLVWDATEWLRHLLATAHLLQVLSEYDAQVVNLFVGWKVVDVNHVKVSRPVVGHNDIEPEQGQFQLVTKALADRAHGCKYRFLRPFTTDRCFLHSVVVDTGVEVLTRGVGFLGVKVHLLGIARYEIRQRASLCHVDGLAKHVAFVETTRVVDKLLQQHQRMNQQQQHQR